MLTASRFGLGVALAALCATAANAQWKRTEFATHGFSAQFPSPPTEDVQEVDGLPMHTWVGLDTQAACLVLYADYGAAVDPEAELLASRDNYVAGLEGARLVSSKRIPLSRGGRQAPALEADTAGPSFRTRAVFVVDGEDVYSVSGLVMNGRADAEQFLETCVRGFKLTPRD